MPKENPERSLGLYLHIPYCLRKCPYCAFNSYSSHSVPDSYVDAMQKELGWGSSLFGLSGMETDSLYFGGGTPSLLAPEQVKDLLSSASKYLSLSEASEITMEMNPATVTEERLRQYLDAGLNRLSIGIQSFDEDKLKRLGRIHSSHEAREIYILARKCGYKNVSIDLMTGLKGEKEDVLKRDLEEAISLAPEHISLYLLSIERGTPFHESVKKGGMKAPDEAEQTKLFLRACEILKEAGYSRYETSNFAKKGFEARHNTKYWKGCSYLGIGAGAHSFISEIGWGLRWGNILLPEDYAGTINSGLFPCKEEELIGRKEALSEALFTGLRMLEGIEEESIDGKFGRGTFLKVLDTARKKLDKKFITGDGKNIRLTEEGALMADEIALSLFRGL